MSPSLHLPANIHWNEREHCPPHSYWTEWLHSVCFSHWTSWTSGMRFGWRISCFYKVQLLWNHWRSADLQSSRRDAVCSSTLDPSVLVSAAFCPFPSSHCNDLLSIKSSPWWAFFPSAFHTLSWVFLLWLFRHCHCLGVLYTVPGGQSAANLFGGIMGYQLLYGCWRDCNGINGSTRLVSLPHCIVDANVKETLYHSVRCQGSVSTDGERCIASCGFLGSMGAVWSWPVHHRWLYMFTEELMTQLKLNGR